MNYEFVLKYELGDITKSLKNDEIMNEYTIIHEIKKSTRKGIYIVTKNNSSDKQKFLLKSKLNDFVNDNEVEIHEKLLNLSHPNIVKIIDIRKSKKFFSIIYEYIDGFNMTYVSINKLYNDNMINIFGDIINGLSFLHENNICHNDLTTNNVIVKKIGNMFVPIIIDFDLSGKYSINNSKRDIWNVFGLFYIYFFNEHILSMNYARIDDDLLENYNGSHIKFIQYIKHVLNNSYMLCPQINEIKKEIVNLY